METTNITHIAHLVEICAQRGINHVVLSPGSRNAPLIIAFDQHPAIKTYLIHDERCAAFFALGLAESLSVAVALCCTSGSAALNYSPALAEAYYRNIPLLALTADRPVALIDQGDGQTIRQKNVFHNFIRAEFELPDFSMVADLLVSDRVVNQAIDQLLQNPGGPVHINIPLAEPLYGSAELVTQPVVSTLEKRSPELTPEEKNDIETVWKSAAKKLILIGQFPGSAQLAEVMQAMINDPSVAILVENTSNFQNFQKVVHCIDRTLAAIDKQEQEAFRPDLLITFGGAVISKKIKTFFRQYKPAVNWRVGQYSFEEDTYQSLTRSFVCDPVHFFEFVASIEMQALSNFGDQWKQKDFIAQDLHHAYLNTIGFNDLKVFEHLAETLPDGVFLHMANSSVVRYCQLFNPVSSVRYFSNRGVSGIDGSTSTAAGFSVGRTEKLNVLVSGDISFFYDSNGLWNNYLQGNFRVIVINNGGGGIFQILEGSNSVKQAPYFFSPYQASIKAICEAFNVNHLEADDVVSLEKALVSFYSEQPGNRPVVLEVKTFSHPNAQVLKDYFRFIEGNK